MRLSGRESGSGRMVPEMIYTEQDDIQVLSLISDKDRGALEYLSDRYSHTVYSVAMSMLRDYGAGEEVTQGVVFKG